MSIVREVTQTREGKRLLQQERTILGVTEMICEIMQDKKVSRKDLADLLGKNKSFVTHLLSGRRNMTVRTLSDLLWALDYSLNPEAKPIPVEVEETGDIDVLVETSFSLTSPSYTITACEAVEPEEQAQVAAVAAQVGQHRSRSPKDAGVAALAAGGCWAALGG